MYYRARYYDPSLGQFISPDTIVPDPAMVIDYNRYAYVRGNPLRRSDPSGHVPCEGMNGTCAGRGGQAGKRSTGANANPCISIICLSTATPNPTPTDPFISIGPSPTMGPQLFQGPSPTPSPTTALPTPTSTLVLTGSLNYPGIYWSFAESTAKEATENAGIKTVFPYAVRASGRTLATVPIPITPFIGYGLSVGPNLYNNISEGNGITSPDLYADLATDTGGHILSVGGGWFGAGVGGLFSGGNPFGIAAGDVVGAVVTSGVWDTWFAPSASAWLSSKFSGE